jgi:hypothetical protein
MTDTTNLTDEDKDLIARMRVTIPPKKAGRLELTRMTMQANDIAALAFYGVRTPEAGEYTVLREHIPGHPKGGILWMSDTTAELADHLPVARRIADPNTKHVLINGLGLGCIAKLACSFDHVKQVDVVEQDSRVIKLVGRWFKLNYGTKIQVIPSDAYDIRLEWPLEGPWDVVWHDIWPNIDEDNLIGMHALHEKYRDHCRWQDSWALELCMMMQDVDRELFKKVEEKDGMKPAEAHDLFQTYQSFLEVEQHYAYFIEQGYRPASREGHPTPLDDLDDGVGRDGTRWVL